MQMFAVTKECWALLISRCQWSFPKSKGKVSRVNRLWVVKNHPEVLYNHDKQAKVALDYFSPWEMGADNQEKWFDILHFDFIMSSQPTSVADICPIKDTSYAHFSERIWYTTYQTLLSHLVADVKFWSWVGGDLSLQKHYRAAKMIFTIKVVALINILLGNLMQSVVTILSGNLIHVGLHHYIVTCQVHPVLVKRIPDPLSCRCPEPRVGLLETPPRWHATTSTQQVFTFLPGNYLSEVAVLINLWWSEAPRIFQ